MRAGAMSVLGDEHSPDLKGVLSPTKMTSDGFSLLSQEQMSWGGGGEHRCPGLWGGGKGGGSQDVAVMSTRDQNLPSTPWREDEAGN